MCEHDDVVEFPYLLIGEQQDPYLPSDKTEFPFIVREKDRKLRLTKMYFYPQCQIKVILRTMERVLGRGLSIKRFLPDEEIVEKDFVDAFRINSAICKATLSPVKIQGIHFPVMCVCKHCFVESSVSIRIGHERFEFKCDNCDMLVGDVQHNDKGQLIAYDMFGMVNIDYSILSFIEQINKYGCETFFCCEGHCKQKNRNRSFEIRNNGVTEIKCIKGSPYLYNGQMISTPPYLVLESNELSSQTLANLLCDSSIRDKMKVKLWSLHTEKDSPVTYSVRLMFKNSRRYDAMSQFEYLLRRINSEMHRLWLKNMNLPS